MPHALTMTMPIKQTPENLERLAQLKKDFATTLQPKIDKALRESKIVHFARVVVIHDQFLQVVTEYDGNPPAYTEFFRHELPDVFAALFALADLPDGITFDDLDQESFFRVAAGLNIPSLGEPADPAGDAEGYLFSAYGTRTVKDVLAKLGG